MKQNEPQHLLTGERPNFFRPDPPDATAVWHIPPGSTIRFRPRYLVLIVLLLIPMTLVATLGSIGLADVNISVMGRFWPAAALQIAFSIWFGIYGSIVGILGPMLFNLLIGKPLLLHLPANIVQSCLVGWAFRYFLLDPRLRHRRDWLGLLLSCLLANALAAALGSIDNIYHFSTNIFIHRNILSWSREWEILFLANAIPSLLLAPILLKASSTILIRGPLFCQSFWGGIDSGRALKLSLHFNDMPIVAKQMLLVLLAGILPLALATGWTLGMIIQRSRSEAAQNNLIIVQKIRNEIERHAMMLRFWATQLKPGNPDSPENRKLIEQWSKIPESFTNLQIVDFKYLQSNAPAHICSIIQEIPVTFYLIRSATLGDNQRILLGAAPIPRLPGKYLFGRFKGRKLTERISRMSTIGGLLVIDKNGHPLCNLIHPDLLGWNPGPVRRPDEVYQIEYHNTTWHVAEAALPEFGWFFIRAVPTMQAQAIFLANIPVSLEISLNLAIFFSLIAGVFIAHRVTLRVLTIADHVRKTGANPGTIMTIPIEGRDEFGYLGKTLSNISRELAYNVKKLQETTAEKERLGAELDLARQVQKNILPEAPPHIPDYELAAITFPALEVGGDFYDFFQTNGDRLVLMIGDAAGKGLKAAMNITETHGMAHTAALFNPTPEHILQMVNSTIISSRGEQSDFVTMFCAALEQKKHILHYASAGHNPPLWLHQGQITTLHLGELPLAITYQNYTSYSLPMKPGDMLVMYTDGISEAFNPQREQFGEKRLINIAREHANDSAERTLKAILEAVKKFVREAAPSDDMTIVVLRRH